MCYQYLIKTSVSGLKPVSNLGSRAIIKRNSFIRELCGDSVAQDDVKINEEGIIVKIVETKLGKSKYHRVHRVEGF